MSGAGLMPLFGRLQGVLERIEAEGMSPLHMAESASVSWRSAIAPKSFGPRLGGAVTI
jgi:hypothetical protein